MTASLAVPSPADRLVALYLAAPVSPLSWSAWEARQRAIVSAVARGADDAEDAVCILEGHLGGRGILDRDMEELAARQRDVRGLVLELGRKLVAILPPGAELNRALLELAQVRQHALAAVQDAPL